MKQRTQISVFVDNRPGTLARIADALAKGGVNILGFAAWGESDHGVVRMVVDDALRASHLLGESGLLCTEAKVLEVRLPNRPGILGRVATRLSRAGVNIDYAYGSSDAADGLLYLKVSPLAKARTALAAVDLDEKTRPAKRVKARRKRARS